MSVREKDNADGMPFHTIGTPNVQFHGGLATMHGTFTILM
jgi:hypothetical protein